MAASRTRTPPEAGADLTGRVEEALIVARVGTASCLGVALSGGVDSVVLLELLDRLRSRFGFRLCAAHVNHGLSPDARRWRDFCRRLCEARRLPFQDFEVAVEPRGVGVEAAARKARLQALHRLPVDWLVFAHHQDDQAETLLFRLLRGAGVRGAGAMSPLEAGSPGVIRPLLAVRRREIVAYARLAGLEWVEDESNRDRRFSRNFLRHDVLPLLESAFPAAVPNLARAAENFREGDVLLDDLAERDSRDCDGPLWAEKCLLSLSDARLRNLLRWRIRRLGFEVPRRVRLEEVVRQLRHSAGALHLRLGGLACARYRGRVWLESVEASAPEPVPWRGQRCIPWGGGGVVFEQETGRGVSAPALRRASEVVVTTRWTGLRMSPGPGRPCRSFKKLCQEAGIPAWLRHRLPVLQLDGEAVWIAGVGVAGAWRCPPSAPGLVPRWHPGGLHCEDEA